MRSSNLLVLGDRIPISEDVRSRCNQWNKMCKLCAEMFGIVVDLEEYVGLSLLGKTRPEVVVSISGTEMKDVQTECRLGCYRCPAEQKLRSYRLC